MLLALGGLAQPAEASHFRYGTLSWAPTGNPNDPAEVRFRLRASFRRTEFGNVNIGDAVQENIGPTVLFFGDGGVTIPLIFRVTAVSLTEDWFLGEAIEGPLSTEFGIVHSYASAPTPPGPDGPFTAFLGGIGSPIPLPVTPAACCRIADPANPQPGEENLANRAGLAYPLQTLVFPTSGNSSPVSTMVPIVVVPPSATATFTVPAVDPDGDPITWRLSTDDEAGGPAHPPNISVDPTTGVVTWNNLGLEQAPTFWTTQFVIEDHDSTGAVKTKTPVDFLLLIRPQVDNLPTCAISPGGPLSATVGNMLSFTVTGTDVDPNDTVTLNAGAIPSGATMTPALPVTGASPQSSVFAWTPAAADVGAHTVMFSATDTAGQQGLCQTTIQVIAGNAAAPTCTISAHPATVQAGTPLTFTLTGADTDAGDTVTLDVAGAGLPTGATMTPALPFSAPTGVTSTFNWTPSATQLGPFTFTFTATDSADQQSQCVTTVDVVANPTAPTCAIDPPGPFTVNAGTAVGFTLTGTDPDPGDTVTLDVGGAGLPGSATMAPPLPFTGSSGVQSIFAWTPTAADAGTRDVVFTVTDGSGQQGSCQTTITVLVAANNPPVCTIEFLSGTGGPGGGGDDDDDNGDHDDEDDDGDNGHDNDGDDDKGRDGNGDSDREGRRNRNRNGQALSILADRESDHDGDDRDDDNGDSDDDDGDDDGNGGNGGGVPAGRLVAFRVTGTDPDLADVLTLTGTVPTGTTMVPPLPLVGGSPVISEGQWTPNLGQVGPQVFSFTVTDLAGAQGFCMATVEVVQRPPRCEIVFPDGGGGGKDDDDKDGDKDDDKDRDHDGDKDRDKDSDGDRDARRARAHRNGGNGENHNGDGDNGDEGGRSVRPGTRVTFRVRATDPDVGDIITLVSGPLPSGAIMDPALPLTGSSPLRSRFLWTPTQTQLGTHVITFTVTDLAGEQGMCRARIKVAKRGRGCPNGDDDKDKDRDKDKDKDKDRDEDNDGDRDGTSQARRATNGGSHRDRDNGDGDNGDGDNGDGEGCKPDDNGHDGGDKDDDKDRDKDKDHDKDEDHDRGDGERNSPNH